MWPFGLTAADLIVVVATVIEAVAAERRVDAQVGATPELPRTSCSMRDQRRYYHYYYCCHYYYYNHYNYYHHDHYNHYCQY